MIKIFLGTITEVVDGDTVKATLDLGLSTRAIDRDLGFHVYVERKRLVMHADLRFYGCNAAEVNTPGGAAAKANLEALLPVGADVDVVVLHVDKYGGRYDARIKMPNGDDLIDQLIGDQWLSWWNGIGIKPVPPWPRTVAA